MKRVKSQMPTMAYFSQVTPELCFVLSDRPLKEAITKMVANGFSQLPVLRRLVAPIHEKDVIGVVTWESVGKHIIKPGFDTSVVVSKVCTERNSVTFCRESDYIKDVAEQMKNEYVMVLNSRHEVICMVTYSDIAALYLNIVRPYSEIEVIESAIRRIVGCLTVSQLRTAARDKSRAMQIRSVDDLEMGEYIALFSKYWNRIGLGCDKSVVMEEMEKLRLIRNSVMHFRPQGVSVADRQVLSGLRALLIAE